MNKSEKQLPTWWDEQLYGKYKKFAELQGWKLRFLPGNWVFAGRQAFWIRGTLFQQLVEDNMRSFNSEQWEMFFVLLPYIVQEKGYFPAYIMSQRYAENYVSYVDYYKNRPTLQDNTGINTLLLRQLSRGLAGGPGHRVYIYGCGQVGDQLVRLCWQTEIHVAGFVVSDSENVDEQFHGLKVYHLSEFEEVYSTNKEHILVLLGLGVKLSEEIKAVLDSKGIRNVRIRY